MFRLFVAICPPADVRQNLLAIMGGVTSARWQEDDQLHLTLRFIGDVDGAVARDVSAALTEIVHPPVEIIIEGVGAFNRRDKVNALWAGVRRNDALQALHRKIDQALVRSGLPPEARIFKPHITLARFGARGGDVANFAKMNAGLAMSGFTAEHFLLLESRLGTAGARYTVIEKYRLIPR